MGGEPDLKAALRALLDQGREEMEPPSPEELIAYRDGLLSARERAAVEERLAVFPEAARALGDLARFPDLEPPPDAEPLSEERLDESWRQFRTRLEAGASEKPEGEPAEPPSPRSREVAGIPAWRQILGPVPGPVWASTAVLAAAVLGWTFGLLSAPSLLPPVHAPEAGVPVLELAPESRTERDAGSPRSRVPEGSSLFVVLELPPGPRARRYEIEIEGPGDRVWTGTAAPSDFGDLHLGLPRDYLTPGEVRITVRRPATVGPVDTGSAKREPAVYRFEVR